MYIPGNYRLVSLTSRVCELLVGMIRDHIQDSVLGSILFNVLLNDIEVGINSSISVFAEYRSQNSRNLKIVSKNQFIPY